ncbi:MAG: M28 family peptidase [Planctomycetota bacterium]|nr:M28 family peptidase [Planctomycetota bacterium]MDA1180124.1 M28 family peptidase [Planctomycetota bacterium]
MLRYSKLISGTTCAAIVGGVAACGAVLWWHDWQFGEGSGKVLSVAGSENPSAGRIESNGRGRSGFLPVAAKSDDDANPINGDRAYDMLKALCDIGPRPSGSPGMQRQQKFLTEYFQGLGFSVERQEFPAVHPLTGKPVKMTNLIVPLYPQLQERILLCAHYDTRPFPDRDPIPGGRRGRFVGANDDASGVAVLGELAHHLRDWNREFGIDIVLFDGEELVFDERGLYFLGSEHFAHQYVKNPPVHQYRWGVLLDMVGDAQLGIFQEKNSVAWPDTRGLVQDIWSTAARLGVREFIARPEYEVRDDHFALRNIARIPTCDIIDFYYPQPPEGQSYWHTRSDTPDKCSPDSLAKVGWVLLEWLKQVRVPPQ